jgi:hypothetical protein
MEPEEGTRSRLRRKESRNLWDVDRRSTLVVRLSTIQPGDVLNVNGDDTTSNINNSPDPEVAALRMRRDWKPGDGVGTG